MRCADLRETQIETITRLTEQGMNIVYLVSDSVSTSKVLPFMRRFPERVINAGIAEQNLIGLASGMANAGFIPFTGNAASFLISRSAEQIKIDAGYSGANIKLNAMHTGFGYGIDGVTHHEVNDISIIRGYPSINIFVPCDGGDCEQITEYAAKYRGPVYTSFSTGNFPIITGENYRFIPGSPIQFSEGRDITIIALGPAIHDVLEAVSLLNSKYSFDIFALNSIRPLDNTPLLNSIKKTGLVLTVEQHSTHGGCGSIAAEMIAENGTGARLKRLGIPEGSFTHNASALYNKKAFSLDSSGISKEIQSFIGK